MTEQDFSGICENGQRALRIITDTIRDKPVKERIALLEQAERVWTQHLGRHYMAIDLGKRPPADLKGASAIDLNLIILEIGSMKAREMTRAASESEPFAGIPEHRQPFAGLPEHLQPFGGRRP